MMINIEYLILSIAVINSIYSNYPLDEALKNKHIKLLLEVIYSRRVLLKRLRFK